MSNTPIADLLDQYEAECCDHTDMEWVSSAALRYVQTMPDSQVRCLLYVLAKHVRYGMTLNQTMMSGKSVSINEQLNNDE